MALRFDLIDDGKSRADLSERRETKFTFNAQHLAAVRSILAGNCRRLVHNEAVSTVRSIYFDDFRLSACAANIDGLGIRQKFRLRWYDTLLPERDLFLEIKWRNNRVTGKHRFQLRASEPVGARSYRELAEALQPVVPTRWLTDFEINQEPVVIVEYQREHFASADGISRLTIDYSPRFYPQWGRSHVSVEFPCELDALALVEGKTPVGRESDLRVLMHPLKLRPSRCSKYVHGCQLLGLVNAGGL